MKVRNVKVNADLSGIKDPAHRDFYRLKAIPNFIKTLESDHWDRAWIEVTGKFKIRLEGELNPKIKKMTNEQLALLIFTRIETDANGIVWHIVDDITIRTYNGPSNVIGYGMPSDDITRVNTDFLSRWVRQSNTRDAGSNLTHEKYHDRDCDHDFKATARRPNSGGYLSGTAFDIAHDIVFKENLPDRGVIGQATAPSENVPPPKPEVIVSDRPASSTRRICHRPWWGLGLITRCYNVEA